MFNPTVQLKSGGYIVIGVTEALVAIDVNSGRATKEGSIEDTALKTNLEAAEEIARQLRLRDLAGLIVIDFIDMEERRNNAAVEKRIKDKLKTDRARIQVGRISGFGLLEMSRQRLRPGMLESTTQPCAHCHGTGLIRSDDSLGLQVLRALEEEGTRKRSKEVLLKAPVGIVNFLFNQKREHLQLIEARYGMAVRIEADPGLISPDYSIEKFKSATRVVPEVGLVISGNASLMGAAVVEDEDFVEADIDEVEAAEDVAETVATAASADAPAPATGTGTGPGKKKRRRRRKKKPGSGPMVNGVAAEAQADDGAEGDDDDDDGGDDTDEALAEAAFAEPIAAAPEPAPMVDAAEPARKPTTRSRSRTPAKAKAAAATAETTAAAAPVAPPKAKAPRSRSPSTRSKAAKAVPTEAPFPADPGLAEAQPSFGLVAAPEEKVAAPAPVAMLANDPDKPKRKGWWSLGS